MNAWNPPRIVTDRLVIRPMMVSDMQAFAQFTGSYDAAHYGNWLGGTDRGSVARCIADTIARYGRPPPLRPWDRASPPADRRRRL